MTMPERPARERQVALMERVAARSLAYRYYHWDWGEAIAMEGLWRAFHATGKERFAVFVQEKVDGWLRHSPDPWYPDHVGPGAILVDLWRHTGDSRYLAYAKLLAAHLSSLPRSKTGGYFNRPDLPEKATMIWVDSMQTDAPFLCRLAQARGDLRHLDAAADRITGHLTALQDQNTGLFYHNYDDTQGHTNGALWARGNGWAILGLVDTLAMMPQEHVRYGALHDSLNRIAAILADLCDRDTGLWHTVLDNGDTYVESSASIMFARAFMKGSRLGLLPANFAALGETAWLSLCAEVEEDGVVRNVSNRTPPRSDPLDYNAIPLGGPFPWGQGPYLLAAGEYLDGRER